MATPEAVWAHWRRHYAATVNAARHGGPVALRVTLAKARREVELAERFGVEPAVLRLSHLSRQL